jgi:hypothetical protein
MLLLENKLYAFSQDSIPALFSKIVFGSNPGESLEQG